MRRVGWRALRAPEGWEVGSRGGQRGRNARFARAEARSQKPEARKQKAEGASDQKPEARSQKPEDRRLGGGE